MSSAPRRRLRRLLVAAALLAGASGILAAILWLALPALLERALTLYLERRGVPVASLVVRRVGPEGIEIVDVRLGEGLRLERLAASWSAAGLLGRALDRVRVEGLRLEVTRTQDGLSVPGLDPLLAPDGEPAADAPLFPALPFSALEIADARVSAADRAEIARVERAVLELGPGGIARAQARVRARAPDLLAGAGLRAPELRAELDLAPGGPLGVHGRARVDSDDTRVRLELRLPRDTPDGRLELALADLAPPGLASGVELEGALDLGRADGALAVGSPHGLRLRVGALDPSLLGRAAEAARAGPLELSLDPELAVAWRDGAVTVRSAGCTRLRVEPFSLPGALRLDAPLELCIEAHDEPLVRAAPSGSAEPGWRAALRVAPADLAVSVTAGARPLALAGRTPRVTLRRVAPGADADARPGVAVRAAGGALRLTDLALVAEALDVDLHWPDGDGAPLRPAGRVRVGRLASLATPAWIRPIELSTTLSPDARDLGFSGQAQRGAALDLTFEGRLSGRRGEARVRASVKLDGDPADVSPLLAGLVERARGEVAGEGEVRWSQEGLDADLALRVGPLDAVFQGIEIEDVAGQMRLTGWPPATPAPARITAAGGSWGQPFRDARAVLVVDAAQRIHLRESGIATLGGHVRASGVLDPRADSQELDVTLEAIDLAEVVSGLGAAGLTATGRLDGSVTAVVEPDGLHLRDGVVQARESGWIRYRPPGRPPVSYESPSAQDLARVALQNFRYTSLRGTLAGRAEGDLRIALRVDGANPDLYDGHPIRLDLNLNGPFLALLRSSQAPLKVPEAIERRLGGQKEGT